MNNYKVNLFFDESGKNKDKCKLMGGLLIPKNIYEVEEITKKNIELQKAKYKLHFTDYNKMDKERYIDVINTFFKYQHFCEMIIINYHDPNGLYEKDEVKKMYYRKLPERIFYGLLRNKGFYIETFADLYIEKANEYVIDTELHKTIVTTLNEQALYRGEKFKIKSFNYKEKNEEIGVEITDLILGIVRNIMEYSPERKSNSYRDKIDLIKCLLSIEQFWEFLSRIKIYEWTSSATLKEITFSQYLNVFKSMNNDLINSGINNKEIETTGNTVNDIEKKD